MDLYFAGLPGEDDAAGNVLLHDRRIYFTGAAGTWIVILGRGFGLYYSRRSAAESALDFRRVKPGWIDYRLSPEQRSV